MNENINFAEEFVTSINEDGVDLKQLLEKLSQPSMEKSK